MTVHHLTEVGSIDVGVNLGGSDVGVTEQLLHDAKIGTADQEMRREAVPELVGMDVLAKLTCKNQEST